MTAAPPAADPRTIEAYARELVRKPTGSRVLALAADPAYRGPAEVDVDGTPVRVQGCVSSLAIRELLTTLPDTGFAIVLTDRPRDDLGDSLVARFRRQRVEPLDAWATIPGLFHARHVPAGVRHAMPWLPGLLLEQMPPTGYPPSGTDEVTLDHIMGALAEQILGVPAGDLGLGVLLDQVGRMPVREAWAGLDPEAQDAIRTWVGDRAGSAAADILSLAAAPTTAHVHVLALGLMLDVLYGTPDPPGEVQQARAAWERGYRLPRVRPQSAAQIGAAARSRMAALATTDPASRHDIWRDTAEAFAIASMPNGTVWSASHPDGYRARLDQVAATLTDAISDPSRLPALEAAATAVAKHDLSRSDYGSDTDRAEMAVRLARWLHQTPAEPPARLADALARQVTVDGWVDRAVSDVWSGSTHAELSAAYRSLCERVLQVRRGHDREFAALLAQTTAHEVLDDDLLPVERVLVDTIAPLSALSPVLMIVIDGMSTAVAAAIGEGISRLAWTEHVPAGSTHRATVLPALPTMTTYSRTSLLCGRLREGTQVEENREFTALTQGPLLHKDDLRTPAGAAVNPDVEAAIASSVPVVGVVLNTVDDSLAKHDPDGTRWSVATIQHLEPLLEVARRHGRIVVLTSDHGHVVERGSRAQRYELADARWRPASTGAPGEDEVLLAGPRVLAGGGAIVAPWTEDLRYGRKTAGYHGGASAAEVTIPLMVFAGRDVDLTPAGWVPAPDQTPPWWDEAAAPVPAPAPAPTRRRRRATPPAGESQASFDLDTTPAEQPTRRDPHEQAIASFLESPTYLRLRAAAGRAALSDGAVGSVLRLLLAGTGRAPGEQVARALGVSAARLPMALSHLRRVLNVEGYPVLAMDADGRTVVLDEVLWRQQFGVAA